MAMGILGQWIYRGRNRNVAIVKQSSQPVSEDTYLNLYDLNALEAIAASLAE